MRFSVASLVGKVWAVATSGIAPERRMTATRRVLRMDRLSDEKVDRSALGTKRGLIPLDQSPPLRSERHRPARQAAGLLDLISLEQEIEHQRGVGWHARHARRVSVRLRRWNDDETLTTRLHPLHAFLKSWNHDAEHLGRARDGAHQRAVLCERLVGNDDG